MKSECDYTIEEFECGGELCTLELCVSYEVTGDHCPPTWNEWSGGSPEEWPEYDIINVTVASAEIGEDNRPANPTMLKVLQAAFDQRLNEQYWDTLLEACRTRVEELEGT